MPAASQLSSCAHSMPRSGCPAKSSKAPRHLLGWGHLWLLALPQARRWHSPGIRGSAPTSIAVPSASPEQAPILHKGTPWLMLPTFHYLK